MVALLAHLLLPALNATALAGDNEGRAALICSVGPAKWTAWQQLPAELKRDVQQDELLHQQDHQCCIGHCQALAAGPEHAQDVAQSDAAEVSPLLPHLTTFSQPGWIIPFSRAPPRR